MNVIAQALNELTRIFEELNKEYFDNELPPAVISIQKARANNYGHFTLNKVWVDRDEKETMYEININPLNMNRSVLEIVETLQHEMCHYYNKLHKLKDCSGKKHNRKFRDTAESKGLKVEKDDKVGFGITTYTDKFKEFVENTIKPNNEVFNYYRTEPIIQKPEREPRQKNVKYTCNNCNLDFKAKPEMNIICGECGCEFTAEKNDENM